jgi:ATP-dependent Lon protease
VLNATRVILVEHMDEVLREALRLSDPDALFGERRLRPLEYRHGKLLEPEQGAQEQNMPEPTVDAPGAQQ